MFVCFCIVLFNPPETPLGGEDGLCFRAAAGFQGADPSLSIYLVSTYIALANAHWLKQVTWHQVAIQGTHKHLNSKRSDSLAQFTTSVR